MKRRYWLLLGIGLSSVLLCLAVLEMGKGVTGIKNVLWPKGVTLKNVSQIHIGMSKEEVERLLQPIRPAGHWELDDKSSRQKYLDNIPWQGEGSVYSEDTELIPPERFLTHSEESLVPERYRGYSSEPFNWQKVPADEIKRYPRVGYSSRTRKGYPVSVVLVYDENQQVFTAYSFLWRLNHEPSDPDLDPLGTDPTLWERIKERWRDCWPW
jgi:hypothetical protein